jgi:hypothetical protein
MARAPPVDAARLEAIAEEHGTPFYLIDETDIRRRVDHLLRSYRDVFGPTYVPQHWTGLSSLPSCSSVACVAGRAQGLQLLRCEGTPKPVGASRRDSSWLWPGLQLCG